MASEAASLGPGRHQARERTIGLLYESEARELSVAELLYELPLEPNPYVVEALQGIEASLEPIDQIIDDHAESWSVDRLPSVDRAILRLAVWELLTQPSAPAAVIIDEAVELAKDYSTERSPSFINGVLDAAARSTRPELTF